MLYGISKDGLLQLAPDGSGKPPITVVAFDGARYTSYRGATPNILFHDGAVYGLHNKAIYKVILPKAGGGIASAAPSVVIQPVQPQPLAAETVAFTEPTGTASAGPAAGVTPAPGQSSGQQPQQQAQKPPSPQHPPANPPADALKKANDAAKSLRGIFGR
jgi:hypothetical protein